MVLKSDCTSSRQQVGRKTNQLLSFSLSLFLSFFLSSFLSFALSLWASCPTISCTHTVCRWSKHHNGKRHKLVQSGWVWATSPLCCQSSLFWHPGRESCCTKLVSSYNKVPDRCVELARIQSFAIFIFSSAETSTSSRSLQLQLTWLSPRWVNFCHITVAVRSIHLSRKPSAVEFQKGNKKIPWSDQAAATVNALYRRVKRCRGSWRGGQLSIFSAPSLWIGLMHFQRSFALSHAHSHKDASGGLLVGIFSSAAVEKATLKRDESPWTLRDTTGVDLSQRRHLITICTNYWDASSF